MINEILDPNFFFFGLCTLWIFIMVEYIQVLFFPLCIRVNSGIGLEMKIANILGMFLEIYIENRNKQLK